VEVAGVDLETLGQTVPGARLRLFECGPSQQAGDKNSTADGLHDFNLLMLVDDVSRVATAS
jgi:hypothetical protein